VTVTVVFVLLLLTSFIVGGPVATHGFLVPVIESIQTTVSVQNRSGELAQAGEGRPRSSRSSCSFPCEGGRC
jgi:hypothetical protein